MSKHGSITTTLTSKGATRVEMEIRHDELNRYQIVSGENEMVVWDKASAVMARWDAEWTKRKAELDRKAARYRHSKTVEEGKRRAADRTREAETRRVLLENLLAPAVQMSHEIDWERLKNRADYARPRPQRKSLPPEPVLPPIPDIPSPNDRRYRPEYDLLDLFVSRRRAIRRKQAAERLVGDRTRWEETRQVATEELERRRRERDKLRRQVETEYQAAVARWEDDRARFLNERDARNALVDQKKSAYLQGEPEAVAGFGDMVLSASEYPHFFPRVYELNYEPAEKRLLVDYQLPVFEAVPNVKEVRFNANKEAFEEKRLSDNEARKLYEQVVVQTALRTVYELFDADVAVMLSEVVFNGYVRPLEGQNDPPDGVYILSILVRREDWKGTDWSKTPPRKIFSRLKGVLSARPFRPEPIEPVRRIESPISSVSRHLRVV